VAARAGIRKDTDTSGCFDFRIDCWDCPTGGCRDSKSSSSEGFAAHFDKNQLQKFRKRSQPGDLLPGSDSRRRQSSGRGTSIHPNRRHSGENESSTGKRNEAHATESHQQSWKLRVQQVEKCQAADSDSDGDAFGNRQWKFRQWRECDREGKNRIRYSERS